MAASTSASTEARVPSTIWSTIGSTVTTEPVGARLASPSGRISPSQHQVGEVVHFAREALLDHGGGAVLLDDGGAFGGEARRQVLATVDLEAGAYAPRAPRPGGRRGLQPWALDQAETGDLPVHELDHVVVGQVPVGVAVDPLVAVVERLHRGGRIEGAGGRARDLVRLAQVADVDGADQRRPVGGGT